MLEKLSWFHLIVLITLVYGCGNGFVCSWGKSSFKMLGLTFSSKFYWGSIAKIASRKMRALTGSMTFVSPEIALDFCKSTIWPCMEYCCHVWAGAPSCYLELLHNCLDQLFSLRYAWGRSSRYSDRLHISVTIPRCCKDVFVISFSPRTAGSRILYL